MNDHDEPEDSSPVDNPVDEGLQHLEAAARELVQAGRSFLDAVESALGNPGGVESFLRNLSGREQPPGDDDGPDDETGYEEIPVDR